MSPDAPEKLDADNRMPLYHQIYLVLRGQIGDGTIRAGDLLPSENDLAKTYGVSRITSRRALDELVADGLARRERGRGTRVIGAAAPQGDQGATMQGLVENVALWGERTSVSIVEFGPVPANDAIAQALRVAPGETVHRAVRVRALDGTPLGHVTSHVPADIGASFTREELAATPLLALLQAKGKHPARAEQTLTATLAEPAVARLLHVAVGAPLLRKIRVVYDDTGRPIEHIDVLYRPDMYQFRLSLSREESGKGDWTPEG